MNTMTTIKNIGFIILAAIILLIIAEFLFIDKPTSEVVIPQSITYQIDSLKAKNAELEKSAKSFDSIINNYKLQISILDSEIVYNQYRMDTVKKKASSTITKVKNYSDNEVDSFFKDRYKY